MRFIELAARPVAPTFDEKHLRTIHHHLFHDIYSWAGQRRTVNTSKPDDPAAFFPCQRFNLGVPATFEQLHDRRFRPDIPRDEFVTKLTATYDEINHLHLFREGNGRAQRIFLSQLAQHSGYLIGWAQISAAHNDEICQAAGHGDTTPMRTALNAIVSERPIDDETTALALLCSSHPPAKSITQPAKPATSPLPRSRQEATRGDELER